MVVLVVVLAGLAQVAHPRLPSIRQPLPSPVFRIFTRRRKEIECLLVVASAADSVVKRV
jgi:hypothetical protein